MFLTKRSRRSTILALFPGASPCLSSSLLRCLLIYRIPCVSSPLSPGPSLGLSEDYKLGISRTSDTWPEQWTVDSSWGGDYPANPDNGEKFTVIKLGNILSSDSFPDQKWSYFKINSSQSNLNSKYFTAPSRPVWAWSGDRVGAWLIQLNAR